MGPFLIVKNEGFLKLKELAQHLLQVRPGEGFQILLFSLLGLTWSIATACSVRLSDALFVLYIGADKIPHSHICIAVALFGVVSILLYAMNTSSMGQIFKSVLNFGLCLFSLLSLYFAAKPSPPLFFYFALSVFCTAYQIVLISCFWSFIDQYFCLQGAKRLYGLLNTFVLLGFSVGGILLSLSFFSLSSLFIIIFSSLFLTQALTHLIDTRFSPIHDDSLNAQAHASFYSFKDVLSKILRSPFTLALLASNLLMQILSIMTETKYMKAFEIHFLSDPLSSADLSTEASLTIFLGQCTSWVSFGNILFGLLFYNRIIRQFGVNRILLFAPACFLLAFSIWQIPSNDLLVPIFGFVIVEGFLYSIEDNNFNLLICAVPNGLKYRVRIILESFFEPLGMLIGSLFLLIPDLDLLNFGLFLAVLTFLIALFESYLFPKALQKNQQAINSLSSEPFELSEENLAS